MLLSVLDERFTAMAPVVSLASHLMADVPVRVGNPFNWQVVELVMLNWQLCSHRVPCWL